MKKYILIQNDGEIETNSFELIGASTKRDEKGKIGFFGSGLKYSIAYMMRKGIDFKIFSGLTELKFTTVNEQLKGKDFARICINGKETSYTVTMGPTWTQDWFVLREVYCNALDESTCQIVRETEYTQPSVGKTRIFIERTPELASVISKWDSYFAEDRIPLFTSEKIYTCYLGSEDESTFEQKVAVYDKDSGVLFRRGIRVYQRDDYMYDYNFHGVSINEDRTARNPDGIAHAIVNLFSVFANEGWIKSILRSAMDENRSMEYMALSFCDIHNPVNTLWIEFSQKNLLVVQELSGRYSEEVNMYKGEVFFVPASFARGLKKKQPDIQIMGMGNVVGNMSYTECSMSNKMNFLLQEVLNSLNEMRYPVPFDIIAADFDKEDVMGFADAKNKKIVIAATTFDKGRREIAMTIMEETEHLRSGLADKTRSFQTHLFSQWLKSMEEANGLFL